ncbi:HNH endonuclease [Plantactinospora sp. WMMB782]|uniref:HNH endonuclease n=1 Tax=Plantactinospora sp. WMMB782 TaxID=3404121 RepID=UPI003B9435F5
MAWEGSNRRSRLPPDWETRRATVLKRDNYRCKVRVDGRRCNEPANEVDHIKRGDNHALSNLQAICNEHHKAKTSREGNEAKKQKRNRYRRPEELHPAEIWRLQQESRASAPGSSSPPELRRA